MWSRSKMSIVVWRGVVVDYAIIKSLIGDEIVVPANSDEIKRYWNRP